jgi:hypothetical protein
VEGYFGERMDNFFMKKSICHENATFSLSFSFLESFSEILVHQSALSISCKAMQCFPVENICFTDIETNCEILRITTSVVSANMALSEKSSSRNLLLYIMVLITILTQKVHTYRINSVRSIAHVSETQQSLPSRSIETNLYAAKKQKKSHPVVPEFSRVLNVGQVKTRGVRLSKPP